jgi:hypothetical protein
MLYTQIEDGKAKYNPTALSYFVEQGLVNVDATAEELAELDIVPVTEFIEQIPNNGYQYTVEIKQQDDGSWAQELVQVEISEEQYQNNVAVQTQAVKADRARMIASSDWVVTKNMEEGTPVPQAWKDYRQALRDIPTQEGFPFNIVWPTLPV